MLKLVEVEFCKLRRKKVMWIMLLAAWLFGKDKYRTCTFLQMVCFWLYIVSYSAVYFRAFEHHAYT